jgi:hypothetical protein
MMMRERAIAECRFVKGFLHFAFNFGLSFLNEDDNLGLNQFPLG